MVALACPDEQMVDRAADAALRILQAHPHINSHSLRYLPSEGQQALAHNLAQKMLFAAWLLPDHESMVSYATKLRKAQPAINDAARRVDEENRDASRRWCPHCRGRRLTRYNRKKIALCCCVCGAVTLAQSPA